VQQGGARQPAGPLAERMDAEGNRTHDANLVMKGADVFSFTLREVPGAVESVMRHAGYVPATTDALVLHQANRFILSTLAKKTGFTAAQTPMSVVEHFGNQSSASIPCALIHGLADRLEAGPLKVVGCGFGVGLSWGAFAGEIGPMTVAPIQTLPR
jgi:3-oxoacyl-[acyl-carrier-protein] synthase-3